MRDGNLERSLATMIGVCLALAAAAVILVQLRPEQGAPRPGPPGLILDPELRRAVAHRLADEVDGIYDAHPDGQVGRVLLPGQERTLQSVLIRTNEFGLRERDYTLPKPEGLLRVVLLGDSFVFGDGVEAEDRLGAFLERFLSEHAPAQTAIECLHMGVSSWNPIAECAYVRRQLHLLQPDLVVQVVCSNDLNDNSGVRGAGLMANFDPSRRTRATGRVAEVNPLWVGGRGNRLPLAEDLEGAQRMRAAGEAMAGLARAVEEDGGRYLLVVHWGPLNAVTGPFWEPLLSTERMVYLPLAFSRDESTWVAPHDAHWNRDGHERMARLLYGLIHGRDLLPGLRLPPWDEASDAVRELAVAGGMEVEYARQHSLTPSSHGKLKNVIEIERLGPRGGNQIYGGIDPQGWLAPYASLVLAAQPHHELHLVGSFLPDPVLEGSAVRVSVEGRAVGRLVVESGASFDVWLPLPDGIDGRTGVNVRLEAEDFVYRGPGLRECVVLRMRRVGFEAP